ncbi:MAG TPA: ABC transporter ATP-binding protein [Haliangiales bacterium]|nr:ABC transporter ATP-binding protein [Haliangiales bacterium]
MLEAHGLRKRFGTLVAVDDVSFSAAAGTCVGLLGPNGAGKTTTVSMVAGILRPDAGEVRIDGGAIQGDSDPRKRRLGLVPQEIALYDELTAEQNLRFFGALYDLAPEPLARAVGEALKLVGLADRGRDRVKTFSGGMKRRLNLAAATLHDPDLLILDEPTVGVDPQSRTSIFDNLEALKARGKAILYTTHYMEEAERLCDRIVIMDHGKVVANDTLRGLSARMPARRLLRVELAAPGDGWLAELGSRPGVESASLADGVLTVGLTDLGLSGEILAWLAGRGLAIEHVATEKADLEGIFLALTGRELRDT